jgi:hypothetical protein
MPSPSREIEGDYAQWPTRGMQQIDWPMPANSRVLALLLRVRLNERGVHGVGPKQRHPVLACSRAERSGEDVDQASA